MGVLDDCLEFIDMMGAGKVLFRTGNAAMPLDGKLTELVERTSAPGGVSLLVSDADVYASGLPSHLHD